MKRILNLYVNSLKNNDILSTENLDKLCKFLNISMFRCRICDDEGLKETIVIYPLDGEISSENSCTIEIRETKNLEEKENV